MDFTVYPDGWLVWNQKRFHCALGHAGISTNKHEGDRATPAGRFALRRLLYRKDRHSNPITALPKQAIRKTDGWCDAPSDPFYNRQVKLPYASSCESLWRTDHLYDLLIVLGHNDNPVQPNLGSAIFLHCARRDYGPTEGCVALSAKNLLELLCACDGDDRLAILARA